MSSLDIMFHAIQPWAVIPRRATGGSAGYDLFTNPNAVIGVGPGEQVNIPLGFGVKIPEGYAMLILSRSGHGFKHRVRLVNSVGLIDPDYTGEVCVALVNDHPTDMLIMKPGSAVAQAVFIPYMAAVFHTVEELPVTPRGSGGFGHTDK